MKGAVGARCNRTRKESTSILPHLPSKVVPTSPYVLIFFRLGRLFFTFINILQQWFVTMAITNIPINPACEFGKYHE